MKRRYKDRNMQRAYDVYRENPPTVVRGGLVYRHGGSMFRIPFWRGFDRITLSGRSHLYAPNSLAHAMYMAGRDYADDVLKGKRKPLPYSCSQKETC